MLKILKNYVKIERGTVYLICINLPQNPKIFFIQVTDNEL